MGEFVRVDIEICLPFRLDMMDFEKRIS